MPDRRTSSLTGSSPVLPAPLIPPAAPAQPAPPKPRHKLSIYEDPDLTARLRAAYRRTLSETSGTFSEFVAGIHEAAVRRLEAEHNGGEPFSGVGPGELPAGRPMIAGLPT